MPTRRLVVARLLATYAVALTPRLRPRQPPLVPRGATRLASTPTTDAEKAYFEKQDTVYDVDEGAWKNDAFWAQVDAELPGWRTDAALERFRGFCENLRTKPPGAGPAPRPSVGGRVASAASADAVAPRRERGPDAAARAGEDLFMDNRQQLLSQYVYPGLGEDAASGESVPRAAYPHDAYPELAELRAKLSTEVAAAARAEFDSVLNARPLADDEDGFDADAGEWDPLGLNEEEEDETWQKAAWFGWQFLSLRGAKTTAPKTTAALVAAMGDLGPAHRFVGFTRQKADSRGTVHSDGRNYMLSTLTPVDAPEGCGIFVDDEEETIATGGDAVILDNTYPHYIYNTADRDRICLMSECWHPALAAAERDALATLFAVKDRFTVLDLGMAPWGYGEDDLAKALKSGAVNDLDYWRRLDYEPPKRKPKAPKKKKVGASGRNKKKAAKSRAFG